MASSSESKGDIIPELKSLLCECNICMLEYDEGSRTPRVLPCSHTFCSLCLKTHSSGSKLVCPLCKTEHKLRNKNITTFQKDNTRRDLLNFLTTKESLAPNKDCDICGLERSALYNCKTCGIIACRDCRVKHQKKSPDHVIGLIEEGQLPPDVSGDHSVKRCNVKGHEKSKLMYYCCSAGCCQELCAHCAIQTHKDGHDVKPIETVYAERHNSMGKMAESVRNQIASHKQKYEKVKTILAALQQSKEAYLDALETNSKKGEAYLISKKRDITSSIDERFRQRILDLERTKEGWKNVIDNAEECCTITDKVLHNENKAQFLSFERTLSKRLCDFKDSPDLNIPELKPLHLDDFKGEIKNFKKLVDSLTNGKFPREQAKSFPLEGTMVSRFGEACRPIINVFLVLFLLASPGLIAYMMDQPYYVFPDGSQEPSYKFFPTDKRYQSCITSDNSTVSTKPITGERQMCGAKGTLYKYHGVYGNKTLLFSRGDQFEITVTGSNVNPVEPWNHFEFLFEFGFSDSSVNGEYVMDTLNRNLWGWAALRGIENNKIILMNRQGEIVDNITVTGPYKWVNFEKSYKVSLLKDSVVELRNIDSNKVIDAVEFYPHLRKIFSVFALYPSNNMAVSLSMSSRIKLGFSRKNTFSPVYVSSSNLTLYNRLAAINLGNGRIPKSVLIRKPPTKDVYFSNVLNCPKECRISLKIKFEDGIPDLDSTALEVGIANVALDKRQSTIGYQQIFKHIKCDEKTGNCLQLMQNKKTIYIPVSADTWVDVFIFFERETRKITFQIEKELYSPEVIIDETTNQRLQVTMFSEKKVTFRFQGIGQYKVYHAIMSSQTFRGKHNFDPFNIFLVVALALGFILGNRERVEEHENPNDGIFYPNLRRRNRT